MHICLPHLSGIPVDMLDSLNIIMKRNILSRTYIAYVSNV